MIKEYNLSAILIFTLTSSSLDSLLYIFQDQSIVLRKNETKRSISKANDGVENTMVFQQFDRKFISSSNEITEQWRDG